VQKKKDLELEKLEKMDELDKQRLRGLQDALPPHLAPAVPPSGCAASNYTGSWIRRERLRSHHHCSCSAPVGMTKTGRKS